MSSQIRPENPIPDAISIANAVMDVIREIDDRSVTPMKLIYLLYEMQGFSLAVNAGPLFRDPIHALECPTIHIESVWNAFVSMLDSNDRATMRFSDNDDFYLSPLYGPLCNRDNDEIYSKVKRARYNNRSIFPVASLSAIKLKVITKTLERYKNFDNHELTAYVINRKNSAIAKTVNLWGYGAQIDLSAMQEEFKPQVNFTDQNSDSI